MHCCCIVQYNTCFHPAMYIKLKKKKKFFVPLNVTVFHAPLVGHLGEAVLSAPSKKFQHRTSYICSYREGKD